MLNKKTQIINLHKEAFKGITIIEKKITYLKKSYWVLQLCSYCCINDEMSLDVYKRPIHIFQLKKHL